MTIYHILSTGKAIKLSANKETKRKLNLSTILLQNENLRKLNGNRALSILKVKNEQ
jgi:hypothetical protein